jgi:Flp pilus assembly protein TadG
MRWVVRLVAISFSLIVSALILVVLAIFSAGNFVAESARK